MTEHFRVELLFHPPCWLYWTRPVAPRPEYYGTFETQSVGIRVLHRFEVNGDVQTAISHLPPVGGRGMTTFYFHLADRHAAYLFSIYLACKRKRRRPPAPEAQ